MAADHSFLVPLCGGTPPPDQQQMEESFLRFLRTSLCSWFISGHCQSMLGGLTLMEKTYSELLASPTLTLEFISTLISSVNTSSIVYITSSVAYSLSKENEMSSSSLVPSIWGIHLWDCPKCELRPLSVFSHKYSIQTQLT